MCSLVLGYEEIRILKWAFKYFKGIRAPVLPYVVSIFYSNNELNFYTMDDIKIIFAELSINSSSQYKFHNYKNYYIWIHLSKFCTFVASTNECAPLCGTCG